MEFRSEFIKSIIEKREEALEEEGIGPSIVERLKMEIDYLKALLVRYEIAKILNLDKDPSLMEKDFFGVEEVSIGDLDLSREDIKRIFELRAQLPKEQLEIYKKRVRLAEILKTGLERSLDSLDNIELAVYSLDRFDLTEEEKAEFRLIADEIKALGSSTKVVPYREEAFAVFQEAFASLNVDTLTDYISVKESNFERIRQVISFIPEEKIASFTEIHNYLFALDLMREYSHIKATVDLESAKKLMTIIETSTLDEEKYTEYLDLLCSSLEKLYEVEDNKHTIEEMLNNINPLKFKLRLDLSNKLHGIENVDFSIKDSELVALFDFIDRNYHSLDEATREAYYHLIEEKLIRASNSIQTVDLVNQFTMRVTNKELERKLRGIFADKPYVKFRNQHDNPFQTIIESKIAALENEKAMCVRKKENGFLFDARYDVRISEIDKEIAALREMKSDFADGKLKSLDESFNKNVDKIIKLEKDIDHLRQLKEAVKLRIVQHSIDKRIEKREKKLHKLEMKKVKIVGKQTKKLIPEIKLKLNEDRKLRRYEARGEVFKKYADDYARLAEAERHLNGMFSGIKAAFYDLKANRYQKKADFNNNMCEELRRRKVILRGGTSRRMSSSTLEEVVRARYPETVHTV